ncbi:zf-CGNR multi-domain protein [Paenibacillus nanensis]|uniref:Zf-CGNR multi-domain protein n=1 Tax=Paenibacillus nanensis TaxID=393251 RepID=A0A3A1ULX0_9BACL|nr:CGNR zinc finger domain-containing protein [Paenibacillus nanensis]RIX48743.1 zf-CGNR multi-domain protein [Paenibacillus nanensis]
MSELWIDYANSLWHDWRGDGHAIDKLPQPEWQSAFLQKHRLTAPVPAPATELEEMARFRDLLREFAQRLYEGGSVTEPMMGAVNEQLQRSAVVRRAALHGEDVRLEWQPQENSWNAVLAEAAADFVKSLASGLGSRIRLCDNDNCKWVFLDDTRNRSKRYCEDKTCGNLMKVRRFRERKKAGDAE